MLRRPSARSLTESWPGDKAAPEVGFASVQSMLIVVVLPAPLGPRKPNTSPGATSKLTPRTASSSPKDLRSSSTSTAFIPSLYGERPIGLGRRGVALGVEGGELRERERGEAHADDA